MGVPDAEDQALFALAEPVGHDGHHPGPPGRLEGSAHGLDPDVVPVRMDVPVLAHAEQDGEDAGQHHADGDVVPQVDPLGHDAAADKNKANKMLSFVGCPSPLGRRTRSDDKDSPDEHEDGVGEQVAGVQESQVSVHHVFRLAIQQVYYSIK